MDKNLLVVEDDQKILLLLKRVLRCFEKNGVGLFLAKNGTEALLIAKRVKPDLVFLDIAMHEVSGLDVCKQIKGDPELNNTKVVFITGKDSDDDKEEGKKAGGDDYITKPFSPDYIIEKADEILLMCLDEHSKCSGLTYLFDDSEPDNAQPAFGNIRAY